MFSPFVSQYFILIADVECTVIFSETVLVVAVGLILELLGSFRGCFGKFVDVARWFKNGKLRVSVILCFALHGGSFWVYLELRKSL